MRMTDFYTDKVTIYNDITSAGETERRFDRFILDKCSVQGGYISKTDGTIQNIVNAVNVLTKRTDTYKPPSEYYQLPIKDHNKYYTVQVGDFVVFGVVDDVVTSSKEFEALQKKYVNNSMIITSVSVNIHNTDVDHIAMTNI